jgi:hypothetical protein
MQKHFPMPYIVGGDIAVVVVGKRGGTQHRKFALIIGGVSVINAAGGSRGQVIHVIEAP